MNGSDRASIREVHDLLASLDARIDEHFHGLRAEMNNRLRSLERWRSYLTGALAMLTFATGLGLALWK